MLSQLFWTVATSDLALAFDGLVLLLSAGVGFVPLGRYLPVIGAYVPAARLLAVLVGLGVAFVCGHRVAGEREMLNSLRATLAIKQRDLDIAAKAAADANKRAAQLQEDFNAQHQDDTGYIASLPARPACEFTDADVRNALGLRLVQGRGSGRAVTRP
ncbi:hypothetical protein ACQR0Z_23030 [Bradyrhizobium sp. HKCCYLS3077]|uniref:hypothetical protein n=1 Tax=Bradyrhizobium sp. HKCCYLS3077 TaxID=3420761 RepID=UPI003EBCAE7E